MLCLLQLCLALLRVYALHWHACLLCSCNLQSLTLMQLRLVEPYCRSCEHDHHASECAVMYHVLLQILDRAFMTAVLLMTTFWQSTSSPIHSPQQTQATAATSNGKRDRSSTNVTSNSSKTNTDEPEAADQSSSLIAAQCIDSLSYLQFCRMRLTAYNSLLKMLLTSVSTSAQVASHSSFCCLLSFHFEQN